MVSEEMGGWMGRGMGVIIVDDRTVISLNSPPGTRPGATPRLIGLERRVVGEREWMVGCGGEGVMVVVVSLSLSSSPLLHLEPNAFFFLAPG